MNNPEKPEQPIAMDMVNQAENLAIKMESLAEYAAQKLRPVARRCEEERDTDEQAPEWPELFALMRSLLWRIDTSATKIIERLNATEV